jgi:glucokinase
VTVNRLINDARLLVQEHCGGMDRVLGVGICCGGPLDREKGVVLGPPNLPGWDGVPVCAMTEEALGIRAYLDNDADCCALAEYLFGAGRGKEIVVAFTWGTGVGAGIVSHGRLYTGSAGLAGEIGHVTYVTDGRNCRCGKRGCIEAYTSGSSIPKIAQELVDSGMESVLEGAGSIDAQMVCDAARSGDQLAAQVLRDAARAMGRAVAIAAHVLNPDVVTLGTMAVKAGDILMPEVLRVVNEEVWECIRSGLIVMPSPLGDRVQDLAAISVFLGRLL